jgi:hypothetical protein
MDIHEIVSQGKFIKYMEYNHDYESTVEIEPLDEDCYDHEVLEDWVFRKKEDAEHELEEFIGREIKEKQQEIKQLRKQLQKQRRKKKNGTKVEFR